MRLLIILLILFSCVNAYSLDYTITAIPVEPIEAVKNPLSIGDTEEAKPVEKKYEIQTYVTAKDREGKSVDIAGPKYVMTLKEINDNIAKMRNTVAGIEASITKLEALKADMEKE